MKDDNIDVMYGGIYKGAFNNSLSDEAKRKIVEGKYNHLKNENNLVEEHHVNRVEYSKNKKKRKVYNKYKKAFVKGCLASLVAVSVVIAGKNVIGNQINQAQYPYEYTQDGYDAVMASRYMLPLNVNDTQYNHAYHYDVIVDGIGKGDFDAELYGAYNAMMDDLDSATALSDLNTLVKYCNLEGYTDCTSFDDYCAMHGYVTEDGKFDAKAYNNNLKEYCRNLEKLDDTEKEVEEFHNGMSR